MTSIASTAVNVDAFAPEFLFVSKWDDRVWLRVQIEETFLLRDARDFGIKDQKGRMVGGNIRIYQVVRTPGKEAEGANRLVRDWHGSKFAMVPQGTRNGVSFGASQSRRYFDTIDQAAAAGERYLADAAKRAAKKFGA